MNDPELSNRVVNLVPPDPGPSRWWWNQRWEKRLDSLPGVYLSVAVAPWHWRIVPWWFVDDLEPTDWVAAWLFLEIELRWPRKAS